MKINPQQIDMKCMRHEYIYLLKPKTLEYLLNDKKKLN